MCLAMRLRVAPHAADVLRGERVEEVEADEVEARLRRSTPALVQRLQLSSKTGTSIQLKSWLKAGAPDDVRDVQDASVLEHRQAVLDARPSSAPTRRRRPARSADLTRIRGAPLGEDVRANLAADRRLRSSARARRRTRAPARTARRSGLSIGTGTWPLSGPESQVWWSAETSIAMSAPELPAPTRSTPPGRSWEGSRYSLECICTMRGSSSEANSGTVRLAVEAGRDDDPVGLEAPLAGLDEVAVARLSSAGRRVVPSRTGRSKRAA